MGTSSSKSKNRSLLFLNLFIFLFFYKKVWKCLYRLTTVTIYKLASLSFFFVLLGSHSGDLLYLWEDQNDRHAIRPMSSKLVERLCLCGVWNFRRCPEGLETHGWRYILPVVFFLAGLFTCVVCFTLMNKKYWPWGFNEFK